jgi:anthranilate/para-aminobenzoate synthase component I
LNIVIRTAVLTPSGGSVGTGRAIVSLSDPQAGFEETMLKVQAVVRAILASAWARESARPFHSEGEATRSLKPG